MQALRLTTKLKALNIVKESKEISQELVDFILEAKTLESVRLEYSVKDKKVIALLSHPFLKILSLSLNFDESFFKVPCRIPYLYIRKINEKDLLNSFFINNPKLTFLSFTSRRGLEQIYAPHFSVKKLKENTFESGGEQRYLLERKTKKRKIASNEFFLERKKYKNNSDEKPQDSQHTSL